MIIFGQFELWALVRVLSHSSDTVMFEVKIGTILNPVKSLFLVWPTYWIQVFR